MNSSRLEVRKTIPTFDHISKCPSELLLFAQVGNSKEKIKYGKEPGEGQFGVIDENSGMETKETLLFLIVKLSVRLGHRILHVDIFTIWLQPMQKASRLTD